MQSDTRPPCTPVSFEVAHQAAGRQVWIFVRAYASGSLERTYQLHFAARTRFSLVSTPGDWKRPSPTNLEFTPVMTAEELDLELGRILKAEQDKLNQGEVETAVASLNDQLYRNGFLPRATVNV